MALYKARLGNGLEFQKRDNTSTNPTYMTQHSQVIEAANAVFSAQEDNNKTLRRFFMTDPHITVGSLPPVSSRPSLTVYYELPKPVKVRNENKRIRDAKFLAAMRVNGQDTAFVWRKGSNQYAGIVCEEVELDKLVVAEGYHAMYDEMCCKVDSNQVNTVGLAISPDLKQDEKRLGELGEHMRVKFKELGLVIS